MKEHDKAETLKRKYPPSLKDNIHTILYGSKPEKEKIQGQFFHLADTPKFMKRLGLKGAYFSIRYGVIARHKNKDADHNLTEQNWIDLCNVITKPLAIAKYGEGYRLFTSVKTDGKYIVVGVDIKNIEKGSDVNSVSTAFKYNQTKQGNEDVIYIEKELTPEQAALLDGLNSLSLPPDQGPGR